MTAGSNSAERVDELSRRQSEPSPRKSEAPPLHPWQLLGLAFAFTWMFAVPAALAGLDVAHSNLGWPAWGGAAGPGLAAVLLIYTAGNRALVADYWRRVIDAGRIGGAWWAFIRAKLGLGEQLHGGAAEVVAGATRPSGKPHRCVDSRFGRC